MTTSPLAAHGISLAYDKRDIIADLSIEVLAGRLTGIIGANGCGKSTLLRGLARLLKPAAGTVLLDGQDIHRLPTREVARRLGILPQGATAPDGLSVAELVSRGRSPHRGWTSRLSEKDESAVAHALEATDLADLADRTVESLSGGQRQRAWIAMALAQETSILLLDEPTTYLDLAHQVEVMDLLMQLNRERGATVLFVLHDLNMACRYSDHLIAMRDGQLMAQGSPGQIVTERLVSDIYGMDCLIGLDPVSQTPLVMPKGRYHPGEDRVVAVAPAMGSNQ